MREAGISSEEINAAVQECAESGGECDCERIAVVVAAAIALLALAIAVRTRNLRALTMARAAIDKARASSRLGRIELDAAKKEIDGVIAREESLAKQFEKTIVILRMLEQNAFSGAIGSVRIIP